MLLRLVALHPDRAGVDLAPRRPQLRHRLRRAARWFTSASRRPHPIGGRARARSRATDLRGVCVQDVGSDGREFQIRAQGRPRGESDRGRRHAGGAAREVRRGRLRRAARRGRRPEGRGASSGADATLAVLVVDPDDGHLHRDPLRLPLRRRGGGRPPARRPHHARRDLARRTSSSTSPRWRRC